MINFIIVISIISIILLVLLPLLNDMTNDKASDFVGLFVLCTFVLDVICLLLKLTGISSSY